MPLDTLPKTNQSTRDEVICYRCLERTSYDKARKIGWTYFSENDEIETYCPDCTKVWNQSEED